MRVSAGLASLAIIAVLGTAHAALQGSKGSNRVSCASLAGTTVAAAAIGLPTSGATVAAADLVPASPQTIAGDRVVLAVPEYCRVTGRIAPVDPAAPPINFHVNLPTSWNRKLAQLDANSRWRRLGH